MKGQNILFLINKFKTGGAEYAFERDIQALTSRGVSVWAASLYGMEKPKRIDASRFFCPQFKGTLDIAAYMRLARFLRREHITCIFATLEHAQVVARVLGVFMPRVRVVIWEVGMADRKPGRYKILDILLNIRVNAIVPISNGVRESLLRYQAIHRQKMTVVPLGIEVPAQLPVRRQDAVFTVLAVGSLRREKGFAVLIDAFAGFLKYIGASARLVIVGKGILEGELKERVHERGIAPDVLFAGQCNALQVRDWYLRAHCFVLSSISEGYPTVVAEAMANGTPIIATRVSGAVDMIEENLSGILVAPNSASELQTALVRLYRDPRETARLGKGAYERARRSLSLEEHIARLSEVLDISVGT